MNLPENPAGHEPAAHDPQTPLAQRRCPPSSAVERLDDTSLDALQASIPQWTRSDKRWERTFEFDNFHQTMAFVNAVAWIAHREDHHPDLQLGYRRCQISWTTHSVGGLSINDAICAARVDALVASG